MQSFPKKYVHLRNDGSIDYDKYVKKSRIAREQAIGELFSEIGRLGINRINGLNWHFGRGTSAG